MEKQTAWHHFSYTFKIKSMFCHNNNNCFSFIFLILFIISSANCNQISSNCSENYLKYAEDHTACKQPKRNCMILKSGVSSYDMATIIATHNTLRNGIASGNETYKGFPSSANMLMLEWDHELAAIAQAHASQCDFQHDCYMCRRTDKYEVVGQNLFLYRTSRPTVRQRWQHAIQLWYDELNSAPKSIVKQFEPKPELNIGHFTQIVWANTKKIGCGYAAYAVPNSIYKVAQLYTCNYAPGGNYIGLQTYQVGSPASRCPRMSKPSFDYKALCKVYKQTNYGKRNRIGGNQKRAHRQHHKQHNHIIDTNKEIVFKKVSQRKSRRFYSRRHRYYKKRTNRITNSV